ncbi:acyl-CoA dehydrogenase family protein [Paraburkholderia ferrariae]|jgi:isovaleryl-CoA dehydrogenase|uniref:acyl-CoA dehydrogenase family protein n=1 Tax=Paraburkholderia ferrariae TaxID=386056 RepID=UPI0006947413|nr:acyl-CoA dehydrogenase family protein [Paraburkholderia ferrariae]
MTATPSSNHAAVYRLREVAAEYARSVPTDAFHWEAWHALSEAGLWRLPVPREEGGAGLTWTAFTEAFEAIVATLRSIGFAMVVANQATLIRALLKHGSAAQRASFLPRLLAGTPAATAISEKHTGTEIRALQTALSVHEEGFLLDGHKYNISQAPTAGIILVAAQLIDGERATTALVLLDGGRPGVTRSAPRDTLGVRDLPIGDLAFEGVPIAANQLLGPPAQGLHRLMDIASMNRAYFGLLCANVVMPFLDDAMRYASERKALDAAIDTHQHVQRRLVDIRIGAESTRWTARAALDQLVAGDPAALANCSVAKLVGARELARSALDLLALHGSDGYRRGPLASFVADALAMTSAGGTEEMHRRNIFAQMQRQAAATLEKPAVPAAPSAHPLISRSPEPA